MNQRLTLRRLWRALDAAGIDTERGSVEAHADRRGAVSAVRVWPKSLARDVRDALVAAGLDESPVSTPPY